MIPYKNSYVNQFIMIKCGGSAYWVMDGQLRRRNPDAWKRKKNRRLIAKKSRQYNRRHK